MKKLLSKTLLLIAFAIPAFSLQAQSPPTDRSLYFDGEDDYIHILNSAPITGNTLHSSTITIEAWVRVCDINGTNTIVSRAYCLANRYAYHFFINSGQLAWQTFENGDCSLPGNRLTTVGAPITEGNWHHVAVVHDPGNNQPTSHSVTLYVDGVAYHHDNPAETIEDGSVGHPIGAVTEPIRIGMVRPATGPVTGSFHGNMDDFMIFHEARQASDILNDMVSSTPVTGATNMKMFLKMDAPMMGRDELVINSINGPHSGLTKNYNNNAAGRPDQTPFTIYNDTEICCGSGGVTSRIANPVQEEVTEVLETLVISPNPNQGKFELYWAKTAGEKGQVEIRSLVTGKLVFKGQVKRGQSIDLGNASATGYNVTVLTDKGTVLSSKTISNLK